MRSIRLIGLMTLSLWLVRCDASRHAHRIRVGWQIPWATQGQVVQVLKHTNILDLHGVEAEFKGFSYGGPLNEAALAGDVDLILTADQPAVTLLANGGKWTVVGRLMYNRVAIYVPPASLIHEVSDLKGKRIAMPYGAAAQRDALNAIRRAGLDPVTDVQMMNLGIYEQMNVVQAGTLESWGEIDALAGFDPTPAILEQKGLARMVHVGNVLSLVLVADEYLARQPETVVGILQALAEAFYYYAKNPTQADVWFQQESRLDFDPAVLRKAAAVEPNVRARSLRDVRITLTDKDLAILQDAAHFLYDQELAPEPLDVTEHVNQTFAQSAMRRLAGNGFDPARIRVEEPD